MSNPTLLTPLSSTKTPTPDSQLDVTASLRKFLYPGDFCVTDYGALGNSTNGSNGQDATQSFRDAYAALVANGGGRLYVPRTSGMYRITGNILMDDDYTWIEVYFEPGAKIIADFAGWVFDRPQNDSVGPTSGVHVFRNVWIEQGNTGGGMIRFNASVPGTIIDCDLHGPGGPGAKGTKGIDVHNSQSFSIINTLVTGCGIGVIAGNATAMRDCDITGCNIGYIHQNLGGVVSGGRFEVNDVAIRLGVMEDGGDWASQGVIIDGLSMESNGISIHAAHVAGLMITACAITVNDGSGDIGIYLDTLEGATVRGVTMSNAAAFATAAIKINNAKCLSIQDVRIGVASGTMWVLGSDMSGVEFGSNVTDVPDYELTRATLLAYESSYQKLPMGARRRISNCNVNTFGAEMTTTGSFHVEVVKGRSNKWYVCGLT